MIFRNILAMTGAQQARYLKPSLPRIAYVLQTPFWLKQSACGGDGECGVTLYRRWPRGIGACMLLSRLRQSRMHRSAISSPSPDADGI